MMNSIVHGRIIFQDQKPVDMEYISTNPAFASVTGITEPVIGRRVSEVIPGFYENYPEMLEIFGLAALTGVTTSWEQYVHELNRWFALMIYSSVHGEACL
jgi:hypothetical protein